MQSVAEKRMSVPCTLHCRKSCANIRLASLNEVISKLESPSIIGGNAAKKATDRFSYWAGEPVEIYEFHPCRRNPFSELNQVLEKYQLKGGIEPDLPAGIFCGGWMGYFSYELARYIEKLPQNTINDLGLPLVRLCFYDKIICYDHLQNEFLLFALNRPGGDKTPEQKLDEIEELLSLAQRTVPPEPKSTHIEEINPGSIRCNMGKEHYLEMVKKIKRYIYDGDVYQINFSRRFECPGVSDGYGRDSFSPSELFHWQNLFNPSGYSAYIDGGDFSIVSASPEMFITIRNGWISTKPIKGTRRRYGAEVENSAVMNRKNYKELLNSEKEKAELNMIVDLERNDLARICISGTREVTQPRTIETYPTVFHAVATVSGKLREELSLCDVLRAVFPGGSITGAPKIRSMEIIDETEPTERSVYTGSIGYIGINKEVCLNIAIRTMIVKNDSVYVQSGGGIVADSVPEAEWNETITKARALLAGIKAVQKK